MIIHLAGLFRFLTYFVKKFEELFLGKTSNDLAARS